MLTRIFLVLFAAAPLFAQTQGLLPTPIDSSGIDPFSCGLNCVTMQEGANTGELIVVAAVLPDATYGSGCGTTINPPWTVTDTLGNTYTVETAAITPSAGGSQNDYIQLAYAVSGSSGANQVTVGYGGGDCGGQIFIARATNISGTKDAITTSTGGPGASPVTATTSTTTTVNGDLLFSFAALNSGPGGNMGLGPALQFLTSKGTTLPEVNATFGFANAGLAGAQSLSTIRYGGNTFGTSVMQTIAFKPSAIAIVDTAMPDGALLNAYKATIHGVGGAGAYTCSITAGSLQTGLSLSGSGNCDITGTPSSASTNSITFRITDGTLSATKTLSLRVTSSFGTPLVINPYLGTFDNGGGSKDVLVSCGDLIVLQIAAGADTHGGVGWLQAQAGVNNYYNDSFGSTVTRVPGVGGIIAGGMLTYLIGPVTQSGLDTVNAKNGPGGSGALEYQISVVRNVQGIADYGSFNNNVTTASATTTLTTSFTAPVSNELVLSQTKDENTGSSISLSAPFSTMNSGSDGFNFYNFGAATGVAAGSVSHAASITSGAGHTQSTQLFGLRPGGISAVCSNFAGLGEKMRRQIW